MVPVTVIVTFFVMSAGHNLRDVARVEVHVLHDVAAGLHVLLQGR